MVNVEITGYKKIEKPEKTLYYLSAISSDIVEGTEGVTTYNSFVSGKYLKECGIEENSLIGSKGKFYNVKHGNTYKSGISLKK